MPGKHKQIMFAFFTGSVITAWAGKISIKNYRGFLPRKAGAKKYYFIKKTPGYSSSLLATSS